VVDFGDGTFGVKLGGGFYRVDADLPTWGPGSTVPMYADLGRGGSLWVAVVEKAYAHYRTGDDTYASLSGGWMSEAMRALNVPVNGDRWLGSYASATALANEVFAVWSTSNAVTVGLLTVPAGCPCVQSHAYTVAAVNRDAAGNVTSIVLRNPWGWDGAGNDLNPADGLVTLTVDQLFACTGRLTWGSV
jgi:hypothetical protein